MALLTGVRFIQLPGATETAASFQFEGEGHTLGNALRFSIMKKHVFPFFQAVVKDGELTFSLKPPGGILRLYRPPSLGG